MLVSLGSCHSKTAPTGENAKEVVEEVEKVVEKAEATTRPVKTTKPDQAMTGGDRDEHGCIGSAGYQWSAFRQECIRTFELKVDIMPTFGFKEGVSDYFFAIPGKGNDNMELYIPNGYTQTKGKQETVILNKGEGKKWESVDNKWILELKEGNYLLSKK